jgi:hypothetical protein
MFHGIKGANSAAFAADNFLRFYRLVSGSESGVEKSEQLLKGLDLTHFTVCEISESIP